MERHGQGYAAGHVKKWKGMDIGKGRDWGSIWQGWDNKGYRQRIGKDRERGEG